MTGFEAELLRPTWFEIDLDAVTANFQQTKRLVGPNVQIICALKGNAYGFGIFEIAKHVVEAGAYGIAVADLFEAVRLRNSGFEAPILLYANNLNSAAESVVRHHLIPTVSHFDSAKAYSEKADHPFGIFVKVDVGLLRAGMLPDKAVPMIEQISLLKNIKIDGIYTHLHFSETDAYVNWQFDKFKNVIDALEKKGIHIPIKMAAATPSVLQYPQTYLNTVDPGRLIYGYQVVQKSRQPIVLQHAFRALKSKIVERKVISPLKEFGKEAPYPVQRETTVGIIPIGWGDGYAKKHASVGPALVHGKRVPVLGGISREHTRIDLTDVPEARIGDDVVLIGRQGDDQITVEEVAQVCGTDVSEVYQSLRNHIARVYIKNGRPFKLETLIGDTLL